MNEALSPRRDALRRGGFTLIEVVIALAIFVFGAVAIIRIFPPALGIIQNSGDKLTALNLDRTTLARLTKEGGAVPDAIHDFYTINDTPFAGAVVGTALRNNSLPKRNVQAVSGSNSAIDHFKFISGEKQRVKSVVVLEGALQTPKVVRYVLTNFPIATGPAVGMPIVFPPVASVYKETNVEGVVARTQPLIGLQPRKTGLLDFSQSAPTFNAGNFPVGPQNFYYVNYDYLEQNPSSLTKDGLLNSVVDEVVRSQTPLTSGIGSIPIDQAQLLQGRRLDPLFSATNDSRVIDGPVQVRFRQLIFDYQANSNPNVTTDKVIQNTLNNLGVLVLTNSPFAVGDEVSIDYEINSWQQIVHNGLPSLIPEVTPSSAPGAPSTRTPKELVLPIRALSDGDDGTLPSPSIYGLLSYFIKTNTGQVVPTLQANALDTSDALITPSAPTTGDPAYELATNNPFFLWSVNRKGGRVVFDVNDHATSPATPSESNVISSRIVFQTLDNWSHQISVASSSYIPYYGVALNNANQNEFFKGTLSDAAGVNVAQPWRYYYWNSASSQPERIYFPPSEAGKTISLSYTYRIGGVTKEVKDGVVTISPNWVPETDAPSGPARELAVADANGDKWLAYAEPQIAGSTALPITSIRSIKGLSIQARTAWLDGSNFTQVSTTGFRGGSN